MIRREINVANGTATWLLISQIHHAHVSGDITRHWQDPFSPEVVDAITHHDDGWSDWEAAPKLNPEIGGPYSFLEMPLMDSLAIWDRSIAAARQFGPLSGYIVAGHFYNLLSDSEHAEEGPAIAWLTAKRKARTSWIDQWLRTDPSHTLPESKKAQQMLMMADLLSLWLCCDCPTEMDQRGECLLEQSTMKPRAEMLQNHYRLAVREFLIGRSARADRATGLAWTVGVDPFPFCQSPLTLGVKGILAPVRHFANWQELLDASWSVDVNWRLVPGESTS